MQIYDGIFECSDAQWSALGTLTVDAKQGNTLKLMLMDEEQDRKVTGIPRSGQFRATPKWIHGTLVNGKIVTLPDAFPVGRQYAFGMAPSIVTWRCPTVLHGEIGFTAGAIELRAARLTLKWLKHWLSTKALKAHPFVPEVGITPPPAWVIAVDNTSDPFDIIVEQTAHSAFSAAANDTYTFSESSSMTVVPREQQALVWFEDRERSLWLLIGLITGVESETLLWTGLVQEQMSIGSNDVDDEHHEHREDANEGEIRWPPDFPENRRQIILAVRSPFNYIELTLERQRHHFSGQESSMIPLVTSEGSSPDLNLIINTWFSREEMFVPLAALWHAATRQDDYYVESRLVNVAQALESLHVKLNPDRTKYLTRPELASLRGVLKEHWPENVPIDRQGQFLGSLPNNLSFRTRMTDLFDEAAEVVRAFSDFESSEELAKAVERYRNAISHGTSVEGCEPRHLSALAKLLAVILQFHLLCQLGWPAADLVTLLQSYPPNKGLFVSTTSFA